MAKADLLEKIDIAIENLKEIRNELRRGEQPQPETRGGDDRKPPPGSGGP